MRMSGSWVAMPTPFDSKGEIDFGAFKLLIDRQIHYGTSALFILGSAGETTLLSLDEKKTIIKEVIKLTKGKIITFFGCSALSTNDSIHIAQYCEAEGADGVIFTIPPYLLIPQTSVLTHFDKCMSSVKIPCGVYNNPSRLGVNIEPKTIAELSSKHPNFIVDKEAMANVSQLVEVKRLVGDSLDILCCDYPKYSIILPTLAVGGTGTANIGGNIIPEEVAKYSRPWDSYEKVVEAREGVFKWQPLLTELYKLTNPIVIKAAFKVLGLPGYTLRSPHEDYVGPHFDKLKDLMTEMGVVEKYSIK
ncbi:dihydrodipicolinate synthase family protein [Miniphocaeibacter halophilus]|uniref:Dihydrodipicolinate synthase family protein n=1 Tax=Miniphocaeibacter halophilus TaxID=2931922 RepID=A0AC61MT28_9FIRM|nr:dihydrodipicolinate synthase family protein [Miniphocaeibacter halophilus]QQK08757.1 dihydrodipicolinate synthase family protein [Miniphocaeibacter halophilus]